MDLPKVEGTQIRGKIYHLNLRIKPEIQGLYGGKSHLRGSLRTSDPKVAAREVRRRKAELLAKEQEQARQAEVDDIVSQLTPEQRAAYDAAGGLEGLLEGFERARAGDAPAPDTAASDAGPEATSEADAPETAAPTRAPAPEADHGAEPVDHEPAAPAQPTTSHEILEPEQQPEAYDETYEGVDDDTAGGYGAQGDRSASTALAPIDMPHELFTLSDLFEEYVTKNEAEGAEVFRQCVRLFTEFNGDIPFEELDVEHLHVFITAAKALPADMSARLADGSRVGDLPFEDMAAWAERTQAKRMSETTRFQYLAMLKELMDFGVPRYRRGDPWSSYRLQVLKREPRAKVPDTQSPAYETDDEPRERRFTRLGEVAILVLAAAILLYLWLG